MLRTVFVEHIIRSKITMLAIRHYHVGKPLEIEVIDDSIFLRCEHASALTSYF